ncbi:helix-turn-helix domain-containing protein [Chryseobacterium sp. S90]|uniref:helix-turn-helix domain-containing protein n=1 Tax=Chryseobacterium sp. S90 TaxID=3395373 RepID=UPI0039BD3C10
MSSTIKIRKICQHCRLEFIAKTTVTKYCSHKCNQRAYKANARELKIQQSKTEQHIPEKKFTPKQNPDSNFGFATFEYLTVKEASVLLKCDRRTVYNMLKNGMLPSANLSIRKTRILKKDIDALFEMLEKPEQPFIFERTVVEKIPLKDCYTIGQIQKQFNISETSLKNLIKRHHIPKFQNGRFVYIPKIDIDPILNKIRSNSYCG